MRPTQTRDKTITFTPPENWDQDRDGPCGALEVRVQTHGGNEIPELVSTWKPDADELAHLNAGGVIELFIITAGKQPPVGMAVVDPVHGPKAEVPHITINEDAHGHG